MRGVTRAPAASPGPAIDSSSRSAISASGAPVVLQARSASSTSGWTSSSSARVQARAWRRNSRSLLPEHADRLGGALGELGRRRPVRACARRSGQVHAHRPHRRRARPRLPRRRAAGRPGPRRARPPKASCAASASEASGSTPRKSARARRPSPTAPLPGPEVTAPAARSRARATPRSCGRRRDEQLQRLGGRAPTCPWPGPRAPAAQIAGLVLVAGDGGRRGRPSRPPCAAPSRGRGRRPRSGRRRRD